MSASNPVRILPERPSLESLRKQAKKLASDVGAENSDALARVRQRLPRWAPPLSLRDAQLVIAREYGFAGWKDLREEVLRRTGHGLDWAASEAGRAIHDNDVERLKALLGEYPGLLTWRDDDGQPLLQATTPYAMDVGDPEREAQFCRPACAALLIDAGAVSAPSVWDILIRSHASGMMRLLHEKNVLPQTLAVLAAQGDTDGVRAALAGTEGRDRETVDFAFMSACRFEHAGPATLLLERAIALDPDLGVQIDRWRDRLAFVADMIANCPTLYGPVSPWPAFVMRELRRAMNDNDLPAFAGWLDDQPWLLDDAHLSLQVELLEQAAIHDREPFIRRLLDRAPAVLRQAEPPPSAALVYVFDYGNAHLVPLLTRIWPLPDDLPHAAAIGNLERVKHWFDDRGRPALGELGHHHRNVRKGALTAQPVLDVALAWAVLNRQFEVAEFLLGHGADINTDWSTHEPASILHECAIQGNLDGARFLVSHGADLTRLDHRWNATPAGWAQYAARDEAMTKLLREAEDQQRPG